MLYYAIQPLGTDLIAIARQALAEVREKAVTVGDLKSGQGTVRTELRERGRLPGMLMRGTATIAPSFAILPTWRTRTSDSTTSSKAVRVWDIEKILTAPLARYDHQVIRPLEAEDEVIQRAARRGGFGDLDRRN